MRTLVSRVSQATEWLQGDRDTELEGAFCLNRFTAPPQEGGHWHECPSPSQVIRPLDMDQTLSSTSAAFLSAGKSLKLLII